MIIEYSSGSDIFWDKFVLEESINGNFLQTRNFYNYHPEGRFEDASFMIVKENDIVAVVSANVIDDGKTLIAHAGSTFGGIVVGTKYANTSGYNLIFDELIKWFRFKGYKRVEIRDHSWLYSPSEMKNELLEYYYQLYGFKQRAEVGFFVSLEGLGVDFEKSFEKLKRRKLNKAYKNGLEFRKFDSEEDIREYYEVLSDNMLKFGTVAVHSLEEMIELKMHRFTDIISFYGVYKDAKMIAGSMVFNFCDKKVFHTQYLASRQDSLEFCPNEFLYTNLIKAAIDEKYRYLSYGTACLEHGKVYNQNLGMYKEGFNTDTYLNKTFIWESRIN